MAPEDTKKPAEDSDDDVPDLEEQEAVAEGDAADESGKVLNRAEKKARKMMQRLGMSPVSGIGRATFRVTGEGGEYYAIEGPDVYEKGGTYVVFGEARQGGGLQQQAAMQQAKAAQQLQEGMEIPTASGSAEGGDEGDEAVNESGVEAKDIELVMSQASCSRAKAVTALKENDGDLVNAIMSLTT